MQMAVGDKREGDPGPGGWLEARTERRPYQEQHLRAQQIKILLAVINASVRLEAKGSSLRGALMGAPFPPQMVARFWN